MYLYVGIYTGEFGPVNYFVELDMFLFEFAEFFIQRIDLDIDLVQRLLIELVRMTRLLQNSLVESFAQEMQESAFGETKATLDRTILAVLFALVHTLGSETLNRLSGHFVVRLIRVTVHGHCRS